MIRRLLLLCDPLNQFFTYIGSSSAKIEFSDVSVTRPNGEMWLHAQYLERLLVNFEGMTKALSADKYPTIPLVSPCLALLKRILYKRDIFTKVSGEHSGEPYCEPVIEKMELVRRVFIMLLESRFRDLQEDIRFCSLLDPRFAIGDHLSISEKPEVERPLVNEAMRLARKSLPDDDAHNASFEVDTDAESDFLREFFKRPKQRVSDEEAGIQSISMFKLHKK